MTGVLGAGSRNEPLGRSLILGVIGVPIAGLLETGGFGRGLGTLGWILTTGIGGGASTAGVGGKWIVTLGGASSDPRRTKSANFKTAHRTCWSASGTLIINQYFRSTM